MKLLVNGEERELPAGATVFDLVSNASGIGREGRGVAVAVDSEVVPRSAWKETRLVDGQHVELLAAIQGGSR